MVAGLDVLSTPGEHSQSRSVHRLRVHERFSVATFDNDVALVRLASPWTFDDYVQPVCTPNNLTHELGLNLSLCFVTGWGSVSYNGGCEDGCRIQAHLTEAKKAKLVMHVHSFL